jgi:hypothetical protein
LFFLSFTSSQFFLAVKIASAILILPPHLIPADAIPSVRLASLFSGLYLHDEWQSQTRTSPARAANLLQFTLSFEGSCRNFCHTSRASAAEASFPSLRPGTPGTIRD